MSGFAAGAISSLVSSGVEALGTDFSKGFGQLGVDKDGGAIMGFAKNSFGSGSAIKAVMIASGGLSGGISSSIAGGSFWKGVREGIITSGLNHAVSHGIEQIKKPKFKDVLEGYPLNSSETDDMDTQSVFELVFGVDYDKSIFTNACATRVSMALNEAGVPVRKDFIGQEGTYKGKGIIASAANLRKWLTSYFGQADVIIENPTDFNQVSTQINGRKGIYIMHPKAGAFSSSSISGHATLWVGGTYNNAVGGHNYIAQAKSIYFWALD